MPNSGLKMRLQTGEREKKILLLQQICKIVSLALQKSLIHVVAFEGMEAGNALMAEYVSTGCFTPSGRFQTAISPKLINIFENGFLRSNTDSLAFLLVYNAKYFD